MFFRAENQHEQDLQVVNGFNKSRNERMVLYYMINPSSKNHHRETRMRYPLLKRFVTFCTLLTPFTLSVGDWYQTNGPYGGYAGSLTVSRKTIVASLNKRNVYRSADSGKSWSISDDGIEAKSSIYYLLENKNKLFVATSSGLYCSVNDGMLWSRANLELRENDWPISIAASDEMVVVGCNEGFFVSVNNGDSWTFIEHQYPEMNCLAVCGGSLLVSYLEYPSLLISRDLGASWINGAEELSGARDFIVRGDTVFAGTYCGVYVSSDRGETWAAANSGLTDSSINDLYSADDTIFSVTEDGVYYSVNSGKSWVPVIRKGLGNNSILNVTKFDNILFAGSNKGVYRLDSSGQSWLPVSSCLAGADVYAMAINGDTIFAGTSDGIQTTVNNGEKWMDLNIDEMTNELDVISLAINESCIFAGTRYHGVFRSDNGGKTWKLTKDGMEDSCITGLVAAGDTIFAGTRHNGLYRSTDNGASWGSMSAVLPYSNVLTLFKHNEKIFVSFWSKGIYISADNGDTWKETGVVAGDLAITANKNDIFVSSWGRHFYSSDGGDSWSQREGMTFSSAIYEPNSGNLFAGAYLGGVYRSADNGKTWDTISGKLEGEHVISLTIKDDSLFAGTYSRGVFKRPVAEVTSIREVKLSGGLYRGKICEFEKNSSGLVMRYFLNTSCDVKVEIYSFTGRRITTVNTGVQAPGSHRLKILKDELTAGFYVYKIRAGSFQESSLLRILK